MAVKSEKRPANHEVTPHVLCDIVGTVLVTCNASPRCCLVGNRVVRFVHCLKQVKERENKDPDQINKMPE